MTFSRFCRHRRAAVIASSSYKSRRWVSRPLGPTALLVLNGELRVNIPVRVVKALMNLLQDINAEVADLLKDKNISPRNLKLLRRVNEVRQLDIAELMVDADNYSSAYVEALILGTPPDQLTKAAPVKKRKKGFSPENIARLESELAMLERDFKAMEAGYGQNVLHLTLASAYIRKLLENINVVAALKAGHTEILAEFQKISALEAL